MTADCGIRGDAQKEMRSCWTYVKCQSRRAKSCKGSEPPKAKRLAIYITLRNFTDSLPGPDFRSVLVKENLRFQFSPASGLTRLASPAKPKVWRPFCLTAVTLRLEAMVRKLGQGVEP